MGLPPPSQAKKLSAFGQDKRHAFMDAKNMNVCSTKSTIGGGSTNSSPNSSISTVSTTRMSDGNSYGGKLNSQSILPTAEEEAELRNVSWFQAGLPRLVLTMLKLIIVIYVWN